MAMYLERGYTLEMAKGQGVGELENWYGSAAFDVFDSSALGSPHRYYCSAEDQLRMINGKTANISAPLMCGPLPADPDIDPIYNWVIHSSSEAGKVHTDYVKFSQEAYVTYMNGKILIANATTVAEIDSFLFGLGVIA